MRHDHQYYYYLMTMKKKYYFDYYYYYSHHSCVQHRAKVNSELYSTLCGFKNIDDLVELDLSKNYVGNEAGFECILELIRSAPQMKILNLTDSGLTTENVTDLVALLLKHPNVTHVKLNLNRLFIDSGVQLVRLARFNSRITQIDVVEEYGESTTDVEKQLANHIPPKLVMEMQRHLRFNRDRIAKASASGQGGSGNVSATTAWRTKMQQQQQHADGDVDEM